MWRKIFLSSAILLTLCCLSNEAMAACEPAQVEVIVRDPAGNLLPGAKVQIWQQAIDYNGQLRGDKSVGSAAADKVSGKALVKVAVKETGATYAISVTNSSLKKNDFWFFDRLNLTCGDRQSVVLNLTGLKIKVMEAGNLQALDNAKITFYEQVADVYGEPAAGSVIGIADTGNLGLAGILLPPPTQLSPDASKFVAMQIKGKQGAVYWRYSLQGPANGWQTLEFKLSEAVVTVRDISTGMTLPKVRLDLYEQVINPLGGYESGKAVGGLTTNDEGKAFWQYPAGIYLAKVKLPNGRTVDFNNLVMEKEKRNQFNLLIDGYNQTKCAAKTDVRWSFIDSQGQTIGNLNFNLYQQQLAHDGRPTASNKVLSGKIDGYGFGKSSFSVSPATKYALEVCQNGVKHGCFWFYDLIFSCAAVTSMNKALASVDLIVRRPDKSLFVGKEIKLYIKQADVDGKFVIDSGRLVWSGKISSSGVVRLFLSPTDWRGEKQAYYLTLIDDDKKQLIAEINPEANGYRRLEYTQNNGQLTLPAVKASSVGGIKGRIVLQVEAAGEAWYINPENNRRYYLGSPQQTLEIMRRLSIGITNKDLNKIPVAIGLSSGGLDSDGDGLGDGLESSLGTKDLIKDTDNDGFSDYEEIANGYNPIGEGLLGWDQRFAANQGGRLLLQTEKAGEVWYVFPLNNKRYFLGNPGQALTVMRELGLGISNKDLSAIAVGSF